MSEGRIRKQRFRADLTVSRAERLLEEQYGLDRPDVVDPATGRSFHGNTKLSTVRERTGYDEHGVPRDRRVRGDGRVGNVERTIARSAGLPPGSIRVRNPDGRDTRSDKYIRNHRDSR